MSYKTLRCERDGAVATVTLDRPEVLNALNAAMFDELEAAFAELAADAGVRVVLLTGAPVYAQHAGGHFGGGFRGGYGGFHGGYGGWHGGYYGGYGWRGGYGGWRGGYGNFLKANQPGNPTISTN